MPQEVKAGEQDTGWGKLSVPQPRNVLCEGGESVRKIALCALKGGVGKSSMTAGLGLALVEQGYKVGFLDCDVTGSNLYSALGLEHSPEWELDRVHEMVVAPEVNGFWLVSIASFAGEDYAVLWEGSHQKELADARDKIGKLKATVLSQSSQPEILGENLELIRRQIDDILAWSKWRFISELVSEEKVKWPPLDYLLADLPPSSSAEMFSFFQEVRDLFGVIIVSQPTRISTIGLIRTIDLLRQKQIPILGLVANQDGFLNKYGELEYQFLSPRVDLREVASKAGISFLLSIPQVGNMDWVGGYFKLLADAVVNAKPVVLKEITLGRRLKRKVVKGIGRRL